MENMNRDRQYKDSARFVAISMLGIIILMIIMVLFSGCTGTYYITDAEYDDAREEHLAITYYNNSIYWGWSNGYYYYYGKPHYYPWYYYYNACPPSHYNVTTHIIISKPVIKPTHKPNRPIIKPTHRPNINVKTNVNRNKVIIKSNRSNKRSINTKKRQK